MHVLKNKENGSFERLSRGSMLKLSNIVFFLPNSGIENEGKDFAEHFKSEILKIRQLEISLNRVYVFQTLLSLKKV